jgi:tRNA(adenine34) deaminase
MAVALEEAEEAFRKEEVPVGAVVVMSGEVIARSHNLRESSCNPLAHAELLALQHTAQQLKRWRLNEATLYVTLEPCCMCAGAVVLARIDRLVYGCSDPKAGACGSVYDIPNDPRLNHRVEVVAGVLEVESLKLLQQFFQDRRATTV